MVGRVDDEPIAIIGASCRFSGDVSSTESLWDMISNAKTGHCKVPSDRWDADLLHHPDPDRKGTMAVKHGYFLKQDVSRFDAPFFQTTAKEAASMDPMKRMLLEVSYESLENAGIPVDTLVNTQTGCYVGCMTNDYEMLSSHDMQDLGYTAGTSNSEAMTANRVSWFFGLRGPSLTLDTACSSSLYTLHLACQSLKLHEADMFLVAGVNLMLYPNTMEQFSAIHMLSPEGISHSFDDRANGYGRGEGIGCLVVKRLADAIRDGDTIRAVVRGTGTNADGKTPSITAPSSEAQADMIRRVYERAGLDLTSTQYFETHGTGTPVGDPIECTAVASTIGAARREAGLGPLYIGSIKPNVGHTEGCAGMAGLLKAMICLEKGMLVPTYDVQRVNPKLTLSAWNLELPARTIKWPTSGQRRISVNSFGFGGANAHVILDDAYHYMKDRGLMGNHNTVVFDDDDGSDSGLSMGPGTPEHIGETALPKRLLVLSSRDQAGNQRQAKAFVDALERLEDAKDDSQFMNNLAYTLASRRSHHNFRTFAIASSVSELTLQLSKPIQKFKQASKLDQNVVFVCTGQGAQWPAMGKQLFSHPTFRASVLASRDLLIAQGCAWDAAVELFKNEDSNIALPEYSQTLCTVLQVALIDLLRFWGVKPRATIGHSSGEIAAAYAAQYLTHADAVRIAYIRGISSAAVTKEGAMMAAGVSRTEAEVYLQQVPSGSAVVACVNSPSSVTLSGDVEAINTLEKTISNDGKFARKLKVKTAYHSPHMRAVADSYLARMGDITAQPGADTVMYSSLTGKVVAPEQLTAQYWVDNMCASVEFSAAMTSLLAHTSQPTTGRKAGTPLRWGAFVEIGPHSALQGPVQQIIAAANNKTAKEAPYVAPVQRNKDANDTSLSTIGSLWAVGIDVDLEAVNDVRARSSVTRPKVLTQLPNYAWNHSRGFWHEAYATRWGRFPLAARTDLLGVPEDQQNKLEPRWRNFLRISENPWIEDHKITGTILYPGAGMLVMALEGILQVAGASGKVAGFSFSDVAFDRGLVVSSGDESTVETRLSFVPVDTLPATYKFTVYSTNTGSSWTKHCFGTVALEFVTPDRSVESSTTDPAWIQQSSVYRELQKASDAEDVDIDTFYEQLDGIGMEYGPLFRNVTALTSVPSTKACHGTIIVPDTKSSMPAEYEYPSIIHPATLDAIFHLLLAAVEDGRPTQESTVPYSLKSLWISADQPQGAGSEFKGYSNLVSKTGNGREVILDMVVSDDAWTAPKIVAEGFALRQVTAGDSTALNLASQPDGLHKCARLDWREDIEFIGNAEDEEWLDLILHKQSVRSALIVLDNELHAAQADGQAELCRKAGISNVAIWNRTTEQTSEGKQINHDLVVIVGAHEGMAQIAATAKGLLREDGFLVMLGANDDASGKGKTIVETAAMRSIADSHGLIVAQNSASALTAALPTDVYFLLPTISSDSLAQLWSGFAALLSSFGVAVHLTADLSPGTSGKHVVSFLEVDAPLIYSWQETHFDAFKELVSTQNHVLWITRGGVVESWKNGVAFAPAQGLLRVMRNEYPFVALPHLDLSSTFDLSHPRSAHTILKVWRASLREGAETEYAETKGRICIPRAVSETGLDADLQLANGLPQPVQRSIRDCHDSMKLSNTIQNGEQVWVEDDKASHPLGVNEIEVDVSFISIDSTDDQAQVKANGATSIARTAAGIITRCGSSVKALAVGQSVVTLAADACYTRLRSDEKFVAALPWNMSPEQAVTIPNAFIAAQYGLLHAAEIEHGQLVLIHDAASSPSQAAIQIAQQAGAKIFALVDSKTEKTDLIARFGLSNKHIFDSSRRHYATSIQQATKGQGVDIIFCVRQTSVVSSSLSLLNESGYVIDVSTNNAKAPQLVLPPSKGNASLIRVDPIRLQQVKPRLFQKLFQATFGRPLAPFSQIATYTASDMGKALAAKREQTRSAVVLSLNKDALIWTMPSPLQQLKLAEQGTYVLAGGLGALGLDIAKMMVEDGAKHLVFLSRSGGGKNEADLKAFEERGVRAEAFKCDVNDAESVASVFAKLRNDGCIIKGLVQCAMVLEDTIFDNMTHAKWWRAFQPKTRGSSNLLEQLRPLGSDPFFILLSSITGVIGNTAQANYASGNTFEDALAHHARAHLGIKATSVDVGLVNDASHFGADGMFGSLKSYLTKYQHGWKGLQCTLEELRTTLRAVMRGTSADGQSIPPQVILGLEDTITREAGSMGYQRDPKFNLRIAAASSEAGESGAASGFNVAVRLGQATSQAEAAAVVEEVFKIQVAAAFGIEVEEVDSNRPMPELGVDSLKAVEIRNHVLKEMQSDVSVFELLSATPMTDVAAKIASRSALVKVQSE